MLELCCVPWYGNIRFRKVGEDVSSNVRLSVLERREMRNSDGWMNLTRHAHAPLRPSRCAYEESSHTKRRNLLRKRYLMRGGPSLASACSVRPQPGLFPMDPKRLSFLSFGGRERATASAAPSPSQARCRKLKCWVCWFCYDANCSPSLGLQWRSLCHGAP